MQMKKVIKIILILISTLTISFGGKAIYAAEVPKLMERESYDYVSGKGDVYYAIGAKRSGNTKYTADLINSITFVTNKTVPSTAETSWDASYTSGNNEVIAWVIQNANDNTKYDLYIGADNNKIEAPAYSYGLFEYYKNCTTINYLVMLDTSKTINMNEMFYQNGSLKNLDLSNFNTLNVTNMNSIFSNCDNLESLDLSSFDTSNVADMDSMFYNCTNLISLNLSNFNTSNVASMYSMFSYCFNLKAIILNKKITASDQAMKLLTDCVTPETYLEKLPNAILYVPDVASEKLYEAATNYSTIFADARDTKDDLYRIRPILEIIGDNLTKVKSNQEYIDEGVKIAGFASGDSINYTQYGFSYVTNGSSIDTTSSEVQHVTYTLKYKNPNGISVLTSDGMSATRSIEVEFEQVNSLNVTLEKDKYECTGSEIKPKLIVKDGDKILEDGTDYSVSYKNNIEPGVATIIITGKGAYSGTKEITFLIYVNKTTLDVTKINPYGAGENHNCNDYAINKYDDNYHWKECKVCNEVIGKKVAHNYATEYWTMGESCSSYNKQIHICKCGYTIETANNREHKNKTKVSSHTQYAHYERCNDCNDWLNIETCKDSNGNRISCQNLGTCATCGEEYNKRVHNATIWNSEGAGYCRTCGAYIGDVKYKINFLDVNKLKVTLYFTMNANYEVSEYHVWDSPFIKKELLEFNKNGEVVTITSNIDILEHIDKKTSLFNAELHWIQSDGSECILILSNLALSPENEAPTLNISDSGSSSDSWNTNYKVTVSGTENYCSSVNITMKDKTTGVEVYNGSASVDSTTRAYSLEFAPNIGADELGKEYEIVVADTLENATSKTITVTKVDTVKPVVNKTSQLDSTGVWATATGWSKTKDFTVTATDEGSQIARIKFQTANGYTDVYGISSRDTSANPITNMRDYRFTGDVYGFVTANVYVVDAAGNETVEQLRIYNLDNTAPSIEYSGKLIRNKEFSIILKDEGSGVSAWQVTKTNAEPTSNWTSVTTEKEVSVKYTPKALGKYYIWAKDAVGNVSLAKEVDVEKIDVDELTVGLEDYTYVFENKQIKPKEIVKDGETVLTKGVDYEVSYGPNFDVGKGSVTITGKGKYDGSKSVLFEITPAPMTGYVTINGINRCGETLTVDVSGINPTGCDFSYKWYTNNESSINGGMAIDGATASKYVPKYEDIGKYIYVEVTASKKNYMPTTFADVTDKAVNKYDTVIGDINRKPTIRFEQKQLDVDEVEITAIIKSVNMISRISVNNVLIDKAEYEGTLIKENYEMTVTLKYRVLVNGIYNFEVEDELGNIVSDKINISTITNKAPAITYKKYNATYFEGAKIVFESDIAVKIKSPEQYKDDGITFDTKYYATRITANIAEGKDLLVDKTFEFESDKQVILYVTVQAPIYTKNLYIRTAKESTSPINVTVSEACSLAEGVSNSKALVGNKVDQYYGIRSNTKVNVATGKDIDVAQVLGTAAKTSSVDAKGIVGKTPSTENVATSNGSYMNSNVTGIYNKTTGMLDTDSLDTNSTEKYSTFRLTIKP